MKQLCGILCALCLLTALLAGLVWTAGTYAPLMTSAMRHVAPPEKTYLPAEHYEGVCEMLTGYLRGELPEFQYTWVGENGSTYLAFQEHEQRHMEDCRALFRLARNILRYAGLAGGVLLVLCVLCGRTAWKALHWTTALVLLAVTALAVWAAVDFNGLFIQFHRVAFTNDLWLLNPNTDLLIRLMPTQLFVFYAVAIGALWAFGALVLNALTRGSSHARPKRKKDKED